ncbi:MAG TPA: right-handed parallel beta-helix repeat-containing protein, partial [Methylococcales bacterium]
QRRFRMNGESGIYTDSWDDLGDSTWRMHLHYPKYHVENIKAGDRFVHMAREGGTAAMTFLQSGDVEINNIHIYASPGTAAIFFQCYGDIHLNGMQIKPRPGSGRIFSLNAGGVHCQSLRKGPLIENCIFEGMADDGMNFYAAPSVITEVFAPDKVLVKEINVLRKGDRIQIIEPSTGMIRAADIEVKSVDGNSITFTKGVEGLKAGKNHVEGDTIFNLSACGNNFIVRNNVIGGLRGRGVLARAHHGLIENNLIRDPGGQGISICNEPDWPEGPIPADITIRNNTVIGANRDSSQQQFGAIQVSAYKLRYKFPDKPDLQKVVIENNKIIDSPGVAILLQGVSDAAVINNLVQLTANDRPIEEYCGIRLDSCKDVKIENFTMADQWGRVDAAVFLDGTSKESVSIKNINADLNKKGQLIKQK